MAEPYVNLSTITLYKTPKFNKIDSVMFSTKAERDLYFDSLPATDKMEMTDFTDLYEGRSIILPHNYLDLKEFNTMKLYYNDGLGHEETYYCNVDNYIYVSTDACYPIYRVDYFLTFSYMLYNKTIAMITDRRTVAENSLTKNMKADDVTVPRYKYTKHTTFYEVPASDPYNKIPYYIVYLNKTTGNVGKLGINCKMQMFIGNDSNNVPYIYNIDTYTIGCYVAIADKDHLDDIIGNEPMEYIEKIIEVDTIINYLHSDDETDLIQNGYVYLEHDIELESGGVNDSYYFCKVNLYNDGKFLVDNAMFLREQRTNIYPNHKKKILEWQPTTGIVIQGMEFDIKDFDDNDFPKVPGGTNYQYMYSTIYFFNFLGYTFAYPMGYKHEEVNMDYMIKWQSGRNFTYTCDYTNSLAYKELQEYNTQAVKYAKQQAGVQAYYNNQLLQNTKESIDISKQQSVLSWQNQYNTLNTNVANIKEEHQSTEAIVNNLFGAVVGTFKGIFSGDIGALSYKVKENVALNNIDLLRQQIGIIGQQNSIDINALNNQYQRAVIETRFQNDCLAIARDNTIANIAISNKYNNAKPNAYYETDYTQFSSYYYTYYIDLTDGDQIEQNIKNRYNVLGTYVGYLENWRPSVYEGLYFDYVKGSIINNSDSVSAGIPNDIYIQLTSRIEEGVRIWHPNELAWFGNLLIDNTNLGTPEPYNTYTEQQKSDLQTTLDTYMYDNLYSIATCKSTLKSTYPTIDEDYIDWLVDNQPWGSATIPNQRKLDLGMYWLFLSYDYTIAEVKDIVKKDDFITVYEKQWVLPLIV